MNYRPDESTLIAYLYGELNEKETKKLEAYFQQHPEELVKLRGLDEVRDVMSHAQDKEVIAPPVFVDEAGVKPFWHSSYFRVSMGIAASFLFLLVAGKLLGPEIKYSNGELRISFGNKTEQPVQSNGLTEEKVNELISSSLAKNNESLEFVRTEDQKKLMQTIADFNSKKMNELTKTASQASQEQVRSFVSSLQEQNLKLMKDYFQLSTSDQKKYMESLLVNFSSYLQEQRKQDLQYVANQMNSLEKNNNQFKQETEQILTSLISNPGKKKNNY
ncbi:MAG TPA: hypothetical protein VGQ59_13210 [Cyclobacteriaceae bacterium]|jgi:hypothetical protein|nr:hypothetical protein [Cyclobacteriaceae bacterium]